MIVNFSNFRRRPKSAVARPLPPSFDGVAGAELQHEIEDLKRTPPMLGRGILQIGIDDLEGACERKT